MSTGTSIEWADHTWSPIIGCDRVSPGCDRCYAIAQANIRSHNPNAKVAAAFADTVHRTEDRLDWTGQVNKLRDRLRQPFGWKKPAKVFVNSMSDLFHARVDDDFIAHVFAVMLANERHVFQVLTKRPARARSLLNRDDFRTRIEDLALGEYGGIDGDVYKRGIWPVPNVWLGVSVEDQHWADIRIPQLLDTPAAVRWLSCEPLLGPIDLWGPLVPGRGRPRLTYWLDGRPQLGPGYTTATGLTMHSLDTGPRIDWVIVGGESGHGARPMHPEWARTLRDQCLHSRVPFLFKQWGQWGPMAPLDKDGCFDWSGGHALADDGTLYAPGDLDYPNGPRYGEAVRANHGRAHFTSMYSLGKKAAGRELDGHTWDQYPGHYALQEA